MGGVDLAPAIMNGDAHVPDCAAVAIFYSLLSTTNSNTSFTTVLR